MSVLISIAAVAVIIALAASAGVTWLRYRKPYGMQVYWLLAAICLSALSALSYMLPESPESRLGGGFLPVLLLGLTFTAVGGFIIHDLFGSRRGRVLYGWLGLCALWLTGFGIVALFSPTANIARMGWLNDLPDALDTATILGLAGLVLAGLVLFGIVFTVFYRAPLPGVANRALYWVLNIAAYLMTLVLLISGNEILILLGLFSLFGASITAIYAHETHRVFDIRGGMLQALITVVLIGMTAALFFAIFYAVSGIDLSTPAGVLVIGLLALGSAVLYTPLRYLIEALLTQLIGLHRIDPTRAISEYSQHVSQAVDLKDVVQTGTATLNRVMGLRSSGVMLVNSTGDKNGAVELLAMQGGAFGPDHRRLTISIPVDGILYQAFAVDHRAISQFDLEYSPDCRDLPESQKHLLPGMDAAAYAPIIMENVFIGLLVCGGKANDTAFYRSDLDLLTTMAQQIGIALRNARLVDDLQHLNSSMRSLNKGLENANKELARLDSVKSDFVTIASHELRTPLAQIRGYTDMIDSINESGMLDADLVRSMANNLRKAAERMEELIAAMLDVSQLDVNSMDLRFTETTPETVLRMAIEPLTNEIKQRKLKLSARWRGLPPIQADLPRLVQAFRNIIVNAIKFTPDGGKIDINATLQPAQGKDGVDHILVTIADSGVGIDPSNLNLIFRKFYRTYDPSLHSTGTYKFLGAGPGLGLTIAKGVIESHGGRIWAESEGHSLEDLPGTTFYVLLPVAPTQDASRTVTIEQDDSDPGNRPIAPKSTQRPTERRPVDVRDPQTDRP